MAKVESWIQMTYIFLSKNQMYDKDEIMGLEQSDWVVGKYWIMCGYKIRGTQNMGWAYPTSDTFSVS